MKENIIIDNYKTLSDALLMLNNIDNENLILFVKSDNNQIIGSITDGDIRRSLIQNNDLNQLVGEVCNKNFVYLIESNDYVNLKKFSDREINILPVLDKKKRFIKTIDLNKTRSILPLDCVIMAGGRGKRLSPLTDSIPKPMLKLGDKPIIEYNIDRLISYGIKNINISINYLGEHIEKYFGDGSKKNININYIKESKPLGTAGSLSLIKNLNYKNLLLLNGDLFTSINFESLYQSLIKNDAEIAIASTNYKVDIPYAIITEKNNIINKIEEKPSYNYFSNAGIYIINNELISKMPKNKFYNITEMIENVLSNGGIIVNDPIRGYWIDIGNPNDYKNAVEFVKYFKH